MFQDSKPRRHGQMGFLNRRLLHSTILILNYVPNSWMTFEYLWVSGVASKQHVLAVGRCRTAGRFPSEWGSCLHISPRGSSERPSFYELRSLAESVASRAAGYTILQVSLMLSVDSKAERSQGSKGVVEHGWTWVNMGEHGWTWVNQAHSSSHYWPTGHTPASVIWTPTSLPMFTRGSWSIYH